MALLQKYAKETCNFKEPTNRSHPIDEKSLRFDARSHRIDPKTLISLSKEPYSSIKRALFLYQKSPVFISSHGT